MGTTEIEEIEKEYDVNNFIVGKEIIEINENIKNVNLNNFDEKFRNVNIDEKTLNKIKKEFLSKKAKEIFEEKELNQDGFLLSKVKIKIENTGDNCSSVCVLGIKITGKFQVIKSFNKRTRFLCCKSNRVLEKKGNLSYDELKRLDLILTKEVNYNFENLFK